MKLAILLVPVGLVAGLAGGHFLAPPATEAEGGTTSEQAEAAPRKPPPLDLSHSDYAKLDTQFIVPVIENDTVIALVVVTMAVEVEKGGRDIVYEHEPRLRDEFLNVLFNHAQSGGFSGAFINSNLMDDLRASLNAAAWSIVGDTAHQVLLTSIIRQDV